MLQQAAMWLFGLAQRTATAKTSVALMEGRKMRNTLESVICLRIVWGLCRCRGVASARVGMIVLELGRCNWRGGGIVWETCRCERDSVGQQKNVAAAVACWGYQVRVRGKI